MKKVFCFLMAIVMTISVFCAIPFVESPFVIKAQAAKNGSCGANVTWTLDDNGTLTITGTGPMENYTSFSHAPWHNDISSVKNVVIGNGITDIGSYSFYNCTSLTSVVIPQSVNNIFNYAFYNCNVLAPVILPDYLSTIGNYAFANCSKLISIIIPDRVVRVGEGAFKYCSKLFSVAMGKAVTTVGAYAFNSCEKLTDFYYAGTSDEWDAISFGAYNSGLDEVNLHHNVPIDLSLSHYGYGVVTTLPSGSSLGIATYTCPCGYSYTKGTTCTGHTYGSATILVRPNCTRYGTAQKRCTKCNTTEFVPYYNEAVLSSSTYPQSPHNYSNNFSQTYSFSHAGATKLILKFSSSTYTESGYDYIYIYDKNSNEIGKYSGYQLSSATVEVPGDSFSIKLTSDYSNTGYGFSFERITAVNSFSDIAPLGHNFSSEWTIDVPSTCNTRGTKSHHCSRCSDRSDITSIPVDANTHNYGEPVLDTAPTCDEPGTLKKICSECNDVATVNNRQSIVVESSLYPESPHNYSDYMSQTYNFSYPTASSLEVTFSQSTETESNYDYIYLYDSDGTQIGKYSGTSLAGKYFEIEGDSFSIKLTSDSSVTRYGFSIERIVAKRYHPLAVPIGHNFASTWTVDTVATCAAAGSKSRHCTRCDAKTDITAIPINSSNHNYSTTWTIDTPATCTSAGSKSHHCTRCNDKKDITTIPIDRNAHNYSTTWTIDTPATCTSAGSKSHHCTRCSAKRDITTIPVDTSAHTYSTSFTVDTVATCTSTGSKSRHCTRCNAKTQITTIPIDNTNHNFSTSWTIDAVATCKESGSKSRHCTRCSAKTDVTVIPADKNNHNYSPSWTVDLLPTCTAPGSKSQHCTRCSAKTNVTSIPIDKNNHNFSGSWTLDKVSTCISKGSKSRHCIRCDAKTDVVVLPIDGKNHNFPDKWTIDVAPTCKTYGSKSHHCTRCDLKKDETRMNPVPHKFGAWQTDTNKAPSATSLGQQTRTCSVCKTIESRTMCAAPKLKSVTNTSNSVYFTWEGVKGATSYIIFRRTGNGSWTELTRNVKTTSYYDKTVKAGTSYKYSVKAISPSNAISDYYTAGLSIKFLTAPKLTSVSNTTTGAKISWGKVTGAGNYEVYRKTGSGGWVKLATVGSSTSSYTDKTAKSGTTYKYTVKAKSGSSLSTYNTSGLSLLFLSTPKLKSVSSSKTGITFKWNKVTKATGYYVLRKTGSGGWKQIANVKGNSKISYLDKSAKKGTTYKYTVKAYSGKTVSAYNTSGLTIKDKY